MIDTVTVVRLRSDLREFQNPNWRRAEEEEEVTKQKCNRLLSRFCNFLASKIYFSIQLIDTTTNGNRMVQAINLV